MFAIYFIDFIELIPFEIYNLSKLGNYIEGMYFFMLLFIDNIILHYKMLEIILSYCVNFHTLENILFTYYSIYYTIWDAYIVHYYLYNKCLLIATSVNKKLIQSYKHLNWSFHKIKIVSAKINFEHIWIRFWN